MESKRLLHFINNNKTNISITIRLFSLISCTTYFVPDEYWQSTEVAHWMVYRNGYITWEWREKIRSYLHPFIFELFFRCVNVIGADTSEILTYAPHVMQAFLSVVADNAVHRLAWNIFRNKDVALFALILHWLSWFVFYTSARTLSNTAEMCFLVLGLSYFPFTYCVEKDNRKYSRNCLFLTILFGGIGCIIRSTSLMIWCPFILGCLISREISLRDLIITTVKVLPVLALLSFGIDYYFYEEFVFAHYNFLKFNIFLNVSTFYGTHPFHWYLTQGIPVVFSFHLLFIAVGVYFSKRILLFLVAMLYIIIHSCIPHKEFRFLLPVFPIFICYAGYGMVTMNQLSKRWSRNIFMLLTVTNVTLALYFSVIHQRGTISVMSYLRNKDLQKLDESVLFLMPCHSTPFYSYLHQDIKMRFLTCDPINNVGQIDESTHFYQNPVAWIENNIEQKSSIPSYIIMFNGLSEKINEKLVSLGYVKEISFFHSHFPEGRVGSYVDVYFHKVAKLK